MKRIFKITHVFYVAILLLSCEINSSEEVVNQTIYIDFEGTQMPLYLHGNGSKKQLLILLHGGPGGNGLEYRSGEYVELLENEMIVAYWDQRGQGMSQGKYGEEKLTVKQMSEDLKAVVLAVKKRFGEDFKVFLLGHSWGGMLGTKFMIDPEKAKLVEGWIEANGAHDIPFLNSEALKMFKSVSKEQIALGNSVEKWQEISDWAEAIDEENITVEMSGEINAKGYEAEGYLLDDGLINQSAGGSGILKSIFFSPLNPIKSAITGSFTSDFLLTEVENTSLTNELVNIQKPCLFIYSKFDFVVPPALGIDAYEKVSSKIKKLIIFQNSGHSTMDSEGSLFSKTIIDFMNEVSN